VLDARQTEEFILTAAQTVLGLALLLDLRFKVWEAVLLFLLFAVQFPSDLLSIPSASSRRSIVRHRSFPRARETRSKNSRLTAARAFFASSRKTGKDGNS